MRVQLLFLIALAASASGAETWSLPLFTSDPRAVLAAAARYQVSDELPAVVLDRSITVEIDESGRLHQTSRTVTKVFRVQGIEEVQIVAVGWSLARQIRPLIKARVITNDGQAHVLDESAIHEQDSQAQNAIGAVKVVAARLPEVDVDSILEVQIQEGDSAPALPGLRFATIEIAAGLPIVHFLASISSAAASDLHVETRSFPGAKITAVPVPKGHSYTVEASLFQPNVVGNFLPPEVAPTQTIAFSNVPSWQAVTSWFTAVLQKTLSPAPTHPPPTGDALPAIEKIYEEQRKQLQDTGLGLAVLPLTFRSPAEILKSGTADSKDEALLLISKLAEAGISAKLALVNSAPAPDVLPTLPGLEAFNHALVVVDRPIPLWIDPAAEYTSVARLPLAAQNRWALVIDPATTQLVRTPASTEKDNVNSSSTEVVLGDGTPTRVSQKIESSGAFSDVLHGLLSRVADSEEAQKEALVTPLFHASGGQRVESVKSSDVHDLLNPSWIETTGEGYAPSPLSDYGGFIDMPGVARLNFMGLTPLLVMSRDNPTQPYAPGRTMDFDVDPAFTGENTVHVVPPPGYRPKELPAVPAVNIGPVSVTAAMSLEKDASVRLAYTLKQPKTRLTPKEVEQMRADFRKIADKTSVRVEFENIALAKMKSGDIAAGMKLLEEDAGNAKGTINPSLRLATGYVEIGNRGAAVKLCEDLLKRDHKSEESSNSGPATDTSEASIRARLGWVYEHDEFGRYLAAGMDAEAAEKNLQQAIDLGYGQATLQLADLYTYNSAGVRYGRGARLNEAADIFDRIDLDTLARTGRLNDYALLLLHARKYAPLREFFLYPQAEKVDQSIRWAAYAASRTDAELMSDMEFRSPSPEERRILLVEAGRRLVAVREYQAALRVFRLAGKGPGVAPVDLDKLGRVHVFDDSALSQQPAAAVFQRYVQAILDPENADDWKKFVSVKNQSETLQTQRYRLLQFFAALNPAPGKSDLLPYFSDLIETTLSFTSEGNDATGFRVRASAGPGSGAPLTVAYILKQGNDYVVAGLANSDAPSIQAAQFARAGNLPTARQWLNWGRETAGRPPLTDADFQAALDLASAQLLLSEGKPQDAVNVVMALHQRDSSNTAATYLLADSLIQSDRTAEANPYIDSLESVDAGKLTALRLRAHSLAQQAKYAEAAAIEKQICAQPNASPADWNDLGWTLLFTGQNAADAVAAAEKAAELTNSTNAAVLHTLAVAQANAGDLKNAISTAYRFAAVSADSGEMHTIFGRIFEQLGFTDFARSYYAMAPQEPGVRLSNYSFAQIRLNGLRNSAPAPNTSHDSFIHSP